MDDEKRKAIHDLIVGNITQEDVNTFLTECAALLNTKEDISPDELAESICNLIFDPLE